MQSSNKTLNYFEVMLKKLDSVIIELRQQGVDFEETQKVQFLKEVVKEQIGDEDSRSTAG
jgi:hypothetical protein